MKIKQTENIPVTETSTWYDIRVFNPERRGWYTRRYNIESLEEARKYVEDHTKDYLYPERFCIVKREVTNVTTYVE